MAITFEVPLELPCETIIDYSGNTQRI